MLTATAAGGADWTEAVADLGAGIEHRNAAWRLLFG